MQNYGISTCNFLDFSLATFGIFILQQIGGDEFIILLIDFNISYAEKVVERLNEKIKSIHEILSLSYGIIEIVNYENIDVESLLATADKKMYEYKKEYKKSYG